MFTLAKSATLLRISFAEANRLVRARKLAVHHVENKVKYIAAETLHAFNAARAAQEAFDAAH